MEKLNVRDGRHYLLTFILSAYFVFTAGSFSIRIVPVEMSNLNQIFAFVFIILFLNFSWCRRKIEFDLLSKIYILFLLYIICSVFWSEGDSQKFYRIILFCTTTTFAFYLSRFYTVFYVIESLYKAMIFVACLSVVIVLFVPSIGIATFSHEGAWNGVFDQKNSLGRCFTVIVFLTFIYSLLSWSWWRFIFCFVFLLLIDYTDSRTSMYLSVLIVFIAVFLKVNSSFISFPINRVFVLSSIWLIVIFLFYTDDVFLGNVSSANDFVSLFGIEIPLTGRATIWTFCIQSLITDQNVIFGYGYDGFWGTSNSIMYKWGMGDFEANDAHNGFIDLLLQGGWCGLFLFFIISTFAFFKFFSFATSKNPKEMYVISMISIFFLIFNLTESTILKSTNFMQFLFSYVIFRGGYLLYR